MYFRPIIPPPPLVTVAMHVEFQLGKFTAPKILVLVINAIVWFFFGVSLTTKPNPRLFSQKVCHHGATEATVTILWCVSSDKEVQAAITGRSEEHIHLNKQRRERDREVTQNEQE